MTHRLQGVHCHHTRCQTKPAVGRHQCRRYCWTVAPKSSSLVEDWHRQTQKTHPFLDHLINFDSLLPYRFPSPQLIKKEGDGPYDQSLHRVHFPVGTQCVNRSFINWLMPWPCHLQTRGRLVHGSDIIHCTRNFSVKTPLQKRYSTPNRLQDVGVRGHKRSSLCAGMKRMMPAPLQHTVK